MTSTVSPKVHTVSRSRSRSRKNRKLSNVGAPEDDFDSVETFWGVSLSATNRDFVWNMKVEKEVDEEEDEEDAEPDRDFMNHTLVLRSATLGAGLTKGEEHVVEVESKDKDNKLIKIPILNMSAGVNPTEPLSFEFQDTRKVTIRLTEGSGPLFLSGAIVQEYPDEEDSQDDSQTETEVTMDRTTESDDVSEGSEDESEEDSEEMSDDEEEAKGKKGGVKRKGKPAGKGKSKQKAKMEEDSEEDEEMDTSIEKKKRGRPTGPVKSPKSATKKGAKADKKKPKAKAAKTK